MLQQSKKQFKTVAIQRRLSAGFRSHFMKFNQSVPPKETHSMLSDYGQVTVAALIK
jgi:hypothetical protein